MAQDDYDDEIPMCYVQQSVEMLVILGPNVCAGDPRSLRSIAK